MFLRALRPAFCAAAFVAALLRCVRFLRPAVIACAAYAFRGTSREGKRGATRGKRPWVFSPRAFRADECGRSTHDPRFPSSFLN